MRKCREALYIKGLWVVRENEESAFYLPRQQNWTMPITRMVAGSNNLEKVYQVSTWYLICVLLFSGLSKLFVDDKCFRYIVMFLVSAENFFIWQRPLIRVINRYIILVMEGIMKKSIFWLKKLAKAATGKARIHRDDTYTEGTCKYCNAVLVHHRMAKKKIFCSQRCRLAWWP